MIINPIQLKDIAITETTANGADYLILQSPTSGQTYKITKADFIAGLASGNSGNNDLSLVNGVTAGYHFDQLSGQQLTDFSSNNYHGTLGNSAGSDSQDPAWVDWALAGLDFYSNKYVSLPSRNWANGSFYIEAVVRLRSIQAWSRVFDFSPSPGATTGNIYLATSQNSSGQPVFGILEGGYTTFIVSPLAIPLYKWVHIAVEFNVGTGVGKIYQNGVLMVSGSLPTPSNIIHSIAWIGKSQFSGDAYLDGNIAAMNIYNKVLSTTERINNIASIKNTLEEKGIFFI